MSKFKEKEAISEKKVRKTPKEILAYWTKERLRDAKPLNIECDWDLPDKKKE